MFFSANLISNIELRQVSISNLIVSSGTKNGDIVVVILILIFLLKGLLSLLGSDI